MKKFNLGDIETTVFMLLVFVTIFVVIFRVIVILFSKNSQLKTPVGHMTIPSPTDILPITKLPTDPR